MATLNMCGDFGAVNVFLLDANMPPSVRHLSLTSMSLKMGDLHSTSITRLCLSDVYVKSDDFAKFPVFFPLLEELILSLDGPDILSIGIPVVLPNLKILGIGILNEFPMVDMTAPRLTRLFMKNEDCDGDTRMLTFPDALSFLKRSRPPLQCIQIYGMELAHADFVALLDSVPSLEELEIFDTDLSIASLKALVLPMESSDAQALRCPGLSVLYVNRVTDQNPPDGLPSLLSGLVRELLTTRRLPHTSTVRKLDYVYLPLAAGELELLQRECHDLGRETEIYSTLDEKRTW